MLYGFLSALIIPGICLGIIAVTVSILIRVRNGLPWERKRKSPFTSQFLRSPGHSVLNQLDDLRFDLLGYMFLLVFIPIMLASVVLTQSAISGKPLTTVTIVIQVVVIAIAITVLIRRSIRLIRKIQHIRLGYEAELAVGQELNQLMTKGFRVYHDFPADNFNIDHIVIGQTGVFAVETKGRSKPNTGDGRADAKVMYDGKFLNFPHWKETEPLVQAKRQATWLTKWLTSAIGEPVRAIPVLAIPGWYIDRKGRSDILIFSGKSPESLFVKYPNDTMLSEQMIQRIAHQVEAKCRDIPPKAYIEDIT